VDDIGADDDGRVLWVRENGDRTGLRNGVDASELNVDSEQSYGDNRERIWGSTYLSMTFA
jgi:hypothetical protein